jgi:HK97 family phage portal protein
MKRLPFFKKGALGRLFSGFGGAGDSAIGYFGVWPFLPGSSFDYRSEAGLLWDNSIVLAGIGWIATTLPEATLGVGRRSIPAGDPEHPAARLIRSPNLDYDGTSLWAGTVLSLVTDGNAYWRKVRSRSGKVTELWYVPHFRIEPVWPRDGSEFISGYAMRVDGQNVHLPKDDIVHLRHHVIDPANERKGMSPIKAALREICTDNESATYTAALLRNSGVPGALLSPEAGPDGRDLMFGPQQQDDLAALWKAKFTGDHRGEPMVAPVPMKVQPFSFNPQQMLVDRVADRSEERICALLNLPPVVLNLGTGLRNANTRASYVEARKAAYEGNIVPTQDRLARQLDLQLLPEFEPRDSGLGFQWDRSAVEVLQESEDARFTRAGQAYRDGILTANEARELLGMASVAGGDSLIAPTVPERSVGS